ncbi:MAG: PAS domain-containing protein [Planctomycetota bacterium]|nr:PAS domain-containing protein [Planctomycetota bacterium]
MIRRFFRSQLFKPCLAFVIVAAVFITYWITAERHERQLLQLETRITSEQIAFRLQNYIATRINLLQGLRQELTTGAILDKKQFSSHVNEVMSNFDGFQAINWIDAEGYIRWINPEAGNESALNAFLREHPVASPLLRRVDRSGESIATPPLDLLQGGRGFATYFPILVNGRSEGYINGVFRLEPMLKASLGSDVTANFNYMIVDEENEVFRFEEDEEYQGASVLAPYPIQVLNRNWQVTLHPRRHLLESHDTPIDEGILVIGLLMALGLAWELWRLDHSRQSLRARTDELQANYQAYPDLQFRVEADGTILDYHTSRLESKLFVQPHEFLGKRMQDVLPDVVGKQFSDAFEIVGREQKSVHIEYTLPIDGNLDSFEARIVPLRDAEMIVIARDITSRKDAENRQRLMMDELDHRVKNTLASILALHEHTRQSSETMEEYSERFSARLLAMARMHETLARNEWHGVGLRRLIHDTMDAYCSENEHRFSLQGDDIMLRPEVSSAMCLAVHELTTNAVKYGSLSNPSGRVDVVWTMIEEDHRLQLIWTESGGPIVKAPSAEGLGLTLIKGLIGSQLGGKVDLDIQPSGLVATMSIPLDRYDSLESWKSEVQPSGA